MLRRVAQRTAWRALHSSVLAPREKKWELFNELLKQHVGDHTSPEKPKYDRSVDRRNRGYPELSPAAKWHTPTKKDPDGVDMVYTHKDTMHTHDVRPGDLVEARKASGTYVGVVLPIPKDREVTGAGQGATLLIVVATGHLEQIRTTDITFQLPQFVDVTTAEKAGPLKWDYVLATAAHTKSAPVSEDMLPESVLEEEPVDLPRFTIRVSICRKIRDMQRQMDGQIRRIFPAFRTLFLPDPSEDMSAYNASERLIRQRARDVLQTGVVSTMEATRLIEQYLHKKDVPIRVSVMFATHTLLMSHPIQFLADANSHRRSQLFMYRPRHDQEILERVSGWVRAAMSEKPHKNAEHATEVLDGFCMRARYVMAWHDKKPAKDYGPPQLDAFAPGMDGKGEFTWTDTDLDILEFFKMCLGNRRELQENVTGSIAMAIIKRAGVNPKLYPLAFEGGTKSRELSEINDRSQAELHTDVLQANVDLQHSLMFEFLTRIGALTPWENPNALDIQFRNRRTIHDAEKNAWELKEELKSRHSFGDMPVYVIDAASSHELDDGMSVEATDNPHQYWIHVHIADPSAWIPKDHALAKSAQHKYSSIYLPELMAPMLPPDVTDSGMSLSDTSKDPMNVLTFSALVDSVTGKVASFDVRRGKVQNIKILHYDQVNQLFLDSHRKHGVSDLRTQQDLRQIAALASVLNRRRVHVGNAVNATDADSSLSIHPRTLDFLAGHTRNRPHFYIGFPEIRVTFADYENVERPGTYDQVPGGITSETMVSEMMILAGRVAASFGLMHNVPLPYRVQPEPNEEEMATINQLKHPDTGTMAMSKLVSKAIFLPTGYSSIKPGIHFALGVRPIPEKDPNSDALFRGGYVRVTSPLRRFADLVCHWQLKAVLDGQAPPFDTETMSQSLVRFDQMDIWIKQMERASQRFWMWTYVDRLLKKKKQYDTECRIDYEEYFTKEERELLSPIPAFQSIMDVRYNSELLESNIRVSLLHFGGLPADCRWPNGKSPPKRDEIKKVKILKTISASTRRTIICSIA